MTKKERLRLLSLYRTSFPYDPEGNAQASIEDRVRCVNGWYDVGWALERKVKE